MLKQHMMRTIAIMAKGFHNQTSNYEGAFHLLTILITSITMLSDMRRLRRFWRITSLGYY